ncbi:MAG: galactokinase [Halobacteriaceae archaeon]
MDAATAFRDAFGASPTAVASAPGRVNLIGGHTDYNDGFVLPAAVDRRVAVAARPREDDAVRAVSTAYPEAVRFAPGDDPVAETWGTYVQGVVWALREAGHRVRGADLAIHGDLPQGAGLGSSAALEVAVGTALEAVGGFAVDGVELAERCRRAENEFVGVSCGLMDQLSATLCRANNALFLDCRSAEYEQVPIPGDVRLVVTDTNVQHSLVDSAYNDRIAECQRGVETLAASLSGVEALRDVTPEELAARRADLDPTVADRCTHVVTENWRVREAADALRAGALADVGELMFDSHASLRDRYGVSCEELDCVVEVARETASVVGARMTGAGFGGCVIALVEPGAVERFRGAFESEYPDRTGVEPSVYVCETADGRRLDAAPGA